MVVPQKPAGATYAVILRLPDFSIGEVAKMGGIGGSAPFPMPKMGESCACCNAPPTTSVGFDAVRGNRASAPPVPVPACAACALHLKRGTDGAQLLGIGVVVVAFGAFYAATNAKWDVLGLCVVAAVALVGIIVWRRRKGGRAAANGHHRNIEIMANAHQCVVRTTNRALAERLVEAHGKEVHRIV